MKIFLSLFFLLQVTLAFSQEEEIIKILNKELKKEIKDQFKNPNFDGDTIALVKDFSIDENKILSVEIKKNNAYGYTIEKQGVPLSKIKIIGKDINIILETEEKDVKTITKRSYKNQEKEAFENNSSMFFTYLHFPNNEDVGDDLIKAFSKAGYKITKSYWYD